MEIEMKRTRQIRNKGAKINQEKGSSDEVGRLRRSKRIRGDSEVEGDSSNSENNESEPIPSPQIKAFKTEDQLNSHALALKLTRIMIKDLEAQSDLSKGYVGGWVVGSYASSYSQGHVLSIFVRDESTSDRLQDAKQLMICIDGNIGEELPSMMSSEYKLFIHQGKISPHIPQYSQDLSKCLLVSGDEPKLWIVHKNANKEGFLQQRACKSGWYQKQKRRRVERSSPPAQERNSFEASQDLSRSSSHRFSLPDDFGFPDSAFNTTHAPGDDTSMASSSESSSASGDDETDQPWKPKGTKQGTAYQYKSLSELCPGDRKVNVFGVVKEFTEAKETRGTDLYTSMVLVDESRPLDGVQCLNFSRTEDRLPRIHRAGDVVSLHRVLVEEYQGRLQLINNNFSSCQRFSGGVGRSFRVHTASRSYTFTSADKKRVKELRRWYQKLSQSLREKLEVVQLYRSFGLVCQVIGITQPKDKECVLLTVWDGTKCRLSLQERVVAEDDQLVSNHSLALSSLAIGFDCQVVISNKDMFNSACSLRPGTVVVINNIAAVESNDSYELCTKTGSSIEILKTSDRSYEELIATLQTAVDTQPTITTTPHQDAPLISAADLQAYHCVSTRAHVRVKILSVATSTLEKMSRLTCDNCDLFTQVGAEMTISEDGHSTNPCPVCLLTGQDLSESLNPHCTFAFQVYVTDLSGSVLKVHVADKEGIRLLNDLPPTNFHQHQQARYKLLQKLYELTGGNQPFSPTTTQPRPWVDCCLLKTKHKDKEIYIMFDTTMYVS